MEDSRIVSDVTSNSVPARCRVRAAVVHSFRKNPSNHCMEVTRIVLRREESGGRLWFGAASMVDRQDGDMTRHPQSLSDAACWRVWRVGILSVHLSTVDESFVTAKLRFFRQTATARP